MKEGDRLADALAMKTRGRQHRRLVKWRARVAASILLAVSLTGGGCFFDHEVEPYYGRINVPRAQEFRWSNGGLPQTFDPARATAPPDTDVVRAMFEGLTEYDPRTLTPVPGVAQRWESSTDAREWTFYLRRDARWSNGEPVTARDFVNSWKRILRMGVDAPHARLLENIVGAQLAPQGSGAAIGAQAADAGGAAGAAASPQPAPSVARPTEKRETKTDAKKEKKVEPAPTPVPFGAEAIDDFTLRVRLVRADANFPALVAHHVFRPVYDAEAALPPPLQTQRVVTNGAFQFARASREGVTLERAGNYWDAQAVALQRVQFVPAQSAEVALTAYRSGDVDAVTNASFEPLALKLLTPYKDFRRATYGALTYYSFNIAREPFTDVRVREALAIVIDRDRICEDEMGGATEPAKKFIPRTEKERNDATAAQSLQLEKDVARAQGLLAAAGFPQGKGFPTIRLLINRNEQQRTVAESVASMWKGSLGIETEVILKSWDEYEAAVRAGEYDVVRRGFVMQTTDEATNMRLMFETGGEAALATTEGVDMNAEKSAEAAPGSNSNTAEQRPDEKQRAAEKSQPQPAAPVVATESEALRELPAIPIYFASSYALVKPYVVGFEGNLLDAPSLKRVRIDTTWKQPKQAGIVWYKNE